jgi:MFS family permease
MAALNAGVLSVVPCGILVDRYGAHRPFFFSGLVLVGLSVAAFSVFQEIGPRMLFSLLQGVGIGAVNTVASLFVVEFSPKEEWNERIGMLQMVNGLGQTGGLMLAGLLSSTGYSPGLWVAAVLMIPAVWIGRRGLPPASKTPPRLLKVRFDLSHLVQRAERLPGSLFFGIHRPGLAHIRMLSRLPGTPFGRFMGSWTLLTLSSQSFFTLLPLLMLHTYRLQPWVSTLIYAACTGLRVLFFNPAGRLSERLGAQRVYVAGALTRTVAFAALVALIFLRTPFGVSLTILFFTMMVCAWPFLSVSGTKLCADLTPVGEGEAMGIFNAMTAAASIASALVSAVLAQAFGYGILPPLALGCAVLSLVMSGSV